MNLLAEIETFLKETGMAPSAFGSFVAGDPKFVFELRRGRSPTERTAEKVRTHMTLLQWSKR